MPTPSRRRTASWPSKTTPTLPAATTRRPSDSRRSATPTRSSPTPRSARSTTGFGRRRWAQTACRRGLTPTHSRRFSVTFAWVDGAGAAPQDSATLATSFLPCSAAAVGLWAMPGAAAVAAICKALSKSAFARRRSAPGARCGPARAIPSRSMFPRGSTAAPACVCPDRAVRLRAVASREICTWM